MTIGLGLGLLAAPFLRAAVVRYAVPYGEPPQGACTECERAFRWLLPSGRCPGCRLRVGPTPWLMELVAAAAFGLVGSLAGGAGALLPVLGWLAGAGVVLGFVDAAVQRLPDALTLPTFLGTAGLLAVAAIAEGNPGVLLRCLLAALAMGAFYGALALVGPMGLGDVKLAPTLGAVLGWYGWSTVLYGLFAGFLVAGVWGAWLVMSRRATGKDSLAFGPFMLIGALIAVVAVAR